MESGGGSWPDDAKKVSLDRILSDELVRAMITVPSQLSFESYCSIIKETDDHPRVYKARSSRSRDYPTAGTLLPSWKQPTDTIRTLTDNKAIDGLRISRKTSVESID